MKYLKLIIFSCSILLLNVGSVMAADFNYDLDYDVAEFKSDDYVDVYVMLKNLDSNGIASGQFEIKYDPSKASITCNDIRIGQEAINDELDCNIKDDIITLLYVDSEGGSSPLKNGSFANLTFKAKEDVFAKDIILSITGEGFAKVSSNGIELLDISVADAEISSQEIENPNTGTFVITTILFILIIICLIFNKLKSYRKFNKV